MNPLQMKDPAAGVPQQLLTHMHLVSKHRYPIVSNLSLETIVGYLIEAPKIMRDLQPVQWQFLDPAPADGRLMLVWQPLDYLSTNFASDGYIWGDSEHVFRQEVRGYNLEMFVHRSGYQAPGEPMASHSRRRYRLVPGNPSIGLPAPDPSLFIVHYSKASPRDNIPAASIPITPHVQAIVQQRRLIQAQGHIARKDFMLHDRANWPTISPPSSIHGRNPSAQLATTHRRGPSVAVPTGEAPLEEEEDVSRGDILDFMTPRDISRLRYEQHHEWMEEILDSHYATMQIIPTGLGLGRKGELEALTNGFFDTPIAVVQETNDSISERVGRMNPEKADDFTRKAAEKIADMQADLERMKRKHARRMKKLQKTSLLSTAEKNLRNAAHENEEHTARTISTGPSRASKETPHRTTEAILDDVERAWGTKVEGVNNVKLVEKGGMDEKTTKNGILSNGQSRSTVSPTKSSFSPSLPQRTPSLQNGSVEATNMPTTDSRQQLPQTLTAATPQLPQQRQESDPAGLKDGVQLNESGNLGMVASDSAAPSNAKDGQTSPADSTNEDIEMDGFDEQGETIEDNMAGNEWVMVSEDGNGSLDTTSQTSPDQGGSFPEMPLEASGSPLGSVVDAADQGSNITAPPQVSGTPGTTAETPVADTGDFDIANEFDSVDADTAGDALADYGEGGEDLDLDTMDDTAFGDAFNPSEDNNTPMNDDQIS